MTRIFPISRIVYKLLIPCVFSGAVMLALCGANAAQAQPAQGLDNPTLSFNLASPNDFSPGLQFIDLISMMRPWIGHKEKNGWGGMNEDELRAGGFIDENGWVTAIPPGFDRVGTIWSWQNFRDDAGDGHAGTYILTYDGDGEINLRGDARVVASSRGRIVFDIANASTFIMEIVRTDPSGDGSYIRNISIVAEDNMDLHQAGAVFNPDWLRTIEDARELRFMDWMNTNGSKVTSWDDMSAANGPRTSRGVAVEHMVRLANEIGADPWFTMPHLADDTYVRNFATYVRDHLDPALTVRVEYSNEVWNFAFSQTHWLRDQAVAAWGEEAYIDYHAKRAVEMALIWEDVFGPDANNGRLVNVVGTLVANPWLSNRVLRAPVWQKNEPDQFVDPVSVFEEIGVTTYFGGATMRNAELRAEMIEKLNDPSVDAHVWLKDRLLAADYRGSIPERLAMLAENAQIAAENGLRLVAYEGGQHAHHSFAVANLSEDDINTLNAFMEEFVRGPHMETLYQVLWDGWKDHGDGAFMQFTDIGGTSRWGTWGLRNSLTDTTRRLELLETLNATTTPWWDGAEGGEFRQQGVTTRGTNGADVMKGTNQEDYLLGGIGDDTIVASPGQDGINGGPGYDIVQLSHNVADYGLRVEGDGYRFSGPQGSDFVVYVEELVFGDDQRVVLADVAPDTDGIIALSVAGQ